jgi:hypothetical protein
MNQSEKPLNESSGETGDDFVEPTQINIVPLFPLRQILADVVDRLNRLLPFALIVRAQHHITSVVLLGPYDRFAAYATQKTELSPKALWHHNTEFPVK